MWEPKDRTVGIIMVILVLAALFAYIGEIMQGIGYLVTDVVAVVIFSWPVLVWILFVLGSLVLLWIAVRVVHSAWRD